MVKILIDKSGEFKVNQIIDEHILISGLSVSGGDMGKVIERSKQITRPLPTFMEAISAKQIRRSCF